jgi:hypothetical protein
MLPKLLCPIGKPIIGGGGRRSDGARHGNDPSFPTWNDGGVDSELDRSCAAALEITLNPFAVR